MTNQLIRFAMVGGLATAVHAGVVLLCEALFADLHLSISNLFGFLVAFPVSYWGQRVFTFAGSGKHRVAIPRFWVSQFIGLSINSAVVFTLVRWFDQEHTAFVLVGIASAVISVFALSKFWVFAPSDR